MNEMQMRIELKRTFSLSYFRTLQRSLTKMYKYFHVHFLENAKKLDRKIELDSTYLQASRKKIILSSICLLILQFLISNIRTALDSHDRTVS
jgi:hypothetical protein